MSRSPASKSPTYTPPHWPKHIRYLTAQQYHPSVSEDILEVIRPRPPPKSQQYPGPQPSFVVIRKITGPPDHPAVGQFGLFAAKKIPPRAYLLDYLGELHCDDRPFSDYDLSLYRTPDGSVNVGIDASTMGNEGRFVNDYRGIRAKPNAQFEERRSDNGELKMSIWTGSESIKKGEEILVRADDFQQTRLTVTYIKCAGELWKIVVESPTTTRVIVVVVNVTIEDSLGVRRRKKRRAMDWSGISWNTNKAKHRKEVVVST